MNLKVPGAILPLGCAILSTRAITVRGVGTTPLRRTRVKEKFRYVEISAKKLHLNVVSLGLKVTYFKIKVLDFIILLFF